MSQQYVTGPRIKRQLMSKYSLIVVSEWVIGHWLWIHVMNCAHDFSPLDTQTMPAGYPFSWKTWQSYQRSIQQSMLLSWRECVLYNGVIRSATVVVLDMVAVTHIIQPQRASIFGEYKHMQLMPCLQSYMTENMSYFGSLVKSFSGTQLICTTSSSQQMLTLYSAINQLIWQPCLHARKKKLTHGWCSILIMLLDKVTLMPFSGL